jgi:hypothetical protein
MNLSASLLLCISCNFSFFPMFRNKYSVNLKKTILFDYKVNKKIEDS